MSRTNAVHVRYNSWYISLPSSAKQQCEMTKFCLAWRTWTTFILCSIISFDKQKQTKWLQSVVKYKLIFLIYVVLGVAVVASFKPCPNVFAKHTESRAFVYKNITFYYTWFILATCSTNVGFSSKLSPFSEKITKTRPAHAEKLEFSWTKPLQSLH